LLSQKVLVTPQDKDIEKQLPPENEYIVGNENKEL
jgi:hypothetical protein